MHLITAELEASHLATGLPIARLLAMVDTVYSVPVGGAVPPVEVRVPTEGLCKIFS